MRKYIFIIVFVSLQLFSNLKTWAQVEPSLLSKETLERVVRVPEFNFIIREADQLGLQVYLFGGTASAFGHYVRWDLEREAGDTKYQRERFDYDFTNIYRGNQDLDIVVDGPSVKAELLQQRLKERFPHFVGNRDAWEVRLLREQVGDKLPLLGDEDFQKQHSDTNSTGMIALNPLKGDKIVYRDLHDWESSNSNFLKDVAGARIKYLFSSAHEQTARFLEGKNPPVLSAVRYIAKLTQYEVSGTKEDMSLVKRIISEVNHAELSSYSNQKVIEFGLKALRNAPDIEYAWNVLEESGLRDLVIKLSSDQNAHSPAWWMNREPLRTRPLGNPSEGRTAQDLIGKKEIIVSHETQSFEAYESITRSAKGGANVFISRNGYDGEVAAYGDGFYTRLGMEGARGTGITIRFKLHPDAIEGVDFTLNGDYLVVTNKAALELIQENIHLTLYNFLTLLMSGQISDNDKGLLEKLRRKFARYQAEKEELSLIVKDFFVDGDTDRLSEEALNYWFASQGSVDFPETVDYVTKRYDCDTSLKCLLPNEHWHSYLKAELNVAELIQRDLGEMDQELVNIIIRDGFGKNLWPNHPELLAPFLRPIEYQFEKNGTHVLELVEHVLPYEPWSKYPKLILRILEDREDNPVFDNVIRKLAEFVFSQEHWGKNKNLFEKLLTIVAKNGYSNTTFKEVAEFVLSKPFSVKYHKTILRLIINPNLNKPALGYFIEHALHKIHWTKHPYLIDEILKHAGNRSDLIQHVFSKKHWWPHVKKHMKTLIEDPRLHASFAEYVFTKDFVDPSQYIDEMVEHSDNQPALIEFILSQRKFKNPEILHKLFRGSDNHSVIAEHIFSQDFWADQEELFIEFLETLDSYNTDVQIALIKNTFVKAFWRIPAVEEYIDKVISEQDSIVILELIKNILSDDTWPKQKQWIIELIKTERLMRDSYFDTFMTYVLNPDRWEEYYPDVVLKILQNDDFSEQGRLEAFAERILLHPYWVKYPKVFRAFFKHDGARVIFLKRIAPFNVNPAFKKIILDSLLNYDNDEEIAQYILPRSEWRNHPELVMILVHNGLVDAELKSYVFSKDFWLNHSVFKLYLGADAEVSLEALRVKDREQPFDKWYKDYVSSTAQMCWQVLN